MYKRAFRFEGYVVCFVSVYTALDYEQSLINFFFPKLLHAKPKHASGKAASHEKRGRKPKKKKEKTADSFVLSGENKTVKVI